MLAKDKAKSFVDGIKAPQDIRQLLETWARPGRQQESKDSNKILTFWKIYGALTPVLQKLALITFSQPVSQSSSEQSFSSYKIVMPPTRNSLSQETQFKCLFIYYNLRKLSGLFTIP